MGVLHLMTGSKPVSDAVCGQEGRSKRLKNVKIGDLIRGLMS